MSKPWAEKFLHRVNFRPGQGGLKFGRLVSFSPRADCRSDEVMVNTSFASKGIEGPSMVLTSPWLSVWTVWLNISC